jgi:hypothetical protein
MASMISDADLLMVFVFVGLVIRERDCPRKEIEHACVCVHMHAPTVAVATAGCHFTMSHSPLMWVCHSLRCYVMQCDP